MSEEKSIRIISFSGKRSDWRVWSRKFLAVAEKRGYKKVLTGALELTSTSSAEDQQLGVNAYNDLLLAMTETISFGLVDESKSAICPEGDAAKAWGKLMKRFESKTSASKVKLMGQLHASKLTKKSKDPEVWISELELLRSRLAEMGTTVDDEFLILHILNNLPSEYDNVVENLEERVDSVLNPLGIEDIRQKLSEKYEKMRLRRKFKEDSDDEDERALFVAKFKGRCNKCGKFGHKAKDCRSNVDNDKEKNQKKKFTGKCFHCGKSGHKEADCWAKHGKPGERANTAEEENEIESDEETVLITIEEDVDFAGVTVTVPKKVNEKKEGSDADTTLNIKKEKGTKEVEDEVIPGVTADMVKPFRPETWTTEMRRDFEEVTSHDYLKMDDPEDKEHKDCPKEPKDNALMTYNEGTEAKESNQIWIGDTGATCHMTFSKEGLTNLKSISSFVIFGNGERLQATHIGDLKGTVIQKDGTETPIFMTKVKYVPQLTYNLFSITAALEHGCEMHGSNKMIKIKKGCSEYKFDHRIKNGKGNLYGIQIVERNCDKITSKETTLLSMNDLHEKLGHPSADITKATATKLNMNINEDKMEKCEYCDIGKMRKKNISKKPLKRVAIAGERVYMDISSIKYPSAGGAKYWVLFVDDYSDFLFGTYMKNKSDLAHEGVKLINKIKNDYGVVIKTIRCDNAGENKSFEKEIIEKGMNIRFEYTAANTPQQNGRVERKFATIYGRVRSMLTGAGIEGALRKSLWAEAGNTAINLINIQVSHKTEKTPYEKFSGQQELPRYINNLHSFGEVGIILKGRNMKSKIMDRGQRAIMVGYGVQNGNEVYRMYKMDTRKITLTRDVRWTGKIYGESKMKLMDSELTISDSESENEDDAIEEKDEDDVEDTETKGMSNKVLNALKQLHTSYNPTLNTLSALVYEDDIALVGGTDYTHVNPTSFQEAWHHSDPKEREAWRAAIRKEFRDMINKNVWRYAKINRIPQNRRLIGNKWVFNKKRNGIYRARLVALGYAQVPGVDHKDNFAPVVTEIAFRTLLMMGLMYNWDFEIVDIETAFLYGELEEEIYMKLPEGLSIHLEMERDDDECLILDKSIYGLVQAARQFHKKLVSVLTEKMNFKKCPGDECLLMREDENGSVVLCVYIDDTLCAGHKKALEVFKQELKNFFATKEEGELDEYVGCQIKRVNEKCMIMHQTELLNKIEQIFGKDIEDMASRKIPFGTNNRVVRPKEGEELISKEEQTKYRSGIGMLLYLVKFSRPDLANAVRELSKVNDGATADHVKNLLRVIKFAIDTKRRVLVYAVQSLTENKWELRAFCDSDWAGDVDDRKSITGFSIFLNGCLISWKSRGQKTVTLSSSEAEYVAVSEVCTEILFIKTITDFLGLEIKLPITIFCDNIGAIYIAHNPKNNGRTKHINVKYHFIREYVVDGTVQINFVRSEDNLADPFTKNVSEETYMKHSAKYLKDRDEM